MFLNQHHSVIWLHNYIKRMSGKARTFVSYCKIIK